MGEVNTMYTLEQIGVLVDVAMSDKPAMFASCKRAWHQFVVESAEAMIKGNPPVMVPACVVENPVVAARKSQFIIAVLDEWLNEHNQVV